MINTPDNPNNNDDLPYWMKINLIPKDIKQAGEVLACFFENKDKEKIRKGISDPAVFSDLGSEIRNNWNLWSETEPLVEYFDELGITSPIDMTELILWKSFSIVRDEKFDLEGKINEIKGN